jgi:hypothetical protein
MDEEQIKCPFILIALFSFCMQVGGEKGVCSGELEGELEALQLYSAVDIPVAVAVACFVPNLRR